MHYITTEGKDLGNSTLQRMLITIKGKGQDSKLKISTDWMPGIMALDATDILAREWSSAHWGVSRPGIAFAESVAIANEVGVPLYNDKPCDKK